MLKFSFRRKVLTISFITWMFYHLKCQSLHFPQNPKHCLLKNENSFLKPITVKIYESKIMQSENCSVMSDSLRFHGLFSRPEYWSEQPFPSTGDLPNPGNEPRSPALQADSLPAEPPEKPKNTGVGSLSLLQGILLTQESNRGLLHCRWILYQLSYQGSNHLYKMMQSAL